MHCSQEEPTNLNTLIASDTNQAVGNVSKISRLLQLCDEVQDAVVKRQRLFVPVEDSRDSSTILSSSFAHFQSGIGTKKAARDNGD